jgi:membrane protease YdiL (CAAX protease family)
MSFTLKFVLALALGLATAVIIAPFAAAAVAAAGFHFPFPRIFDRTVMVTLLVALLCFARPLRLFELLREGFARPRANLVRTGAGLLLALVAVGALFGIAAYMGSSHSLPYREIAMRASSAVLAAIVIAILEEGFFRAFLLAGMESDFDSAGAVLLSSAIYAMAHVVRAPPHYYLIGIHPAAGIRNLAESAVRLSHPLATLPELLGLFLLGVVLGEAFLLSRTVYFSIGMHMGFVLSAKSWPALADSRMRVPRWLAGRGPVPLIGAPAAWAMAIALMLLLPTLIGRPAPPEERRQLSLLP